MDFGGAGDSWDLYRSLDHHDIDLEYAAHEFFHLWNVKRIRPLELGPFDYSREVYTTSLWIMEGFTDYYGYLTLVRTGLWSPRKWLRMYSNIITRYRRAHGWKYRSPNENSFDVWLWNYGEGEQGNLERTYFSYYPGGNLLGLCMDLRIRDETKNQRNLDDVMRALLQRFGLPKPGFTEAQFWSTVTEVTGLRWEDFRRRYAEGTEELRLDQNLALAGIQVDTLSDFGVLHLGLSVKEENGQAHVAAVEYDSPAETAGLEAGDRLVAIEREEVTLENWEDLLQRRAAGDKIKLTIIRHGGLQEISAVMGKPNASDFELSLDSAAPEEAHTLRERWWRGYASERK
jgi:predicted metalloprotease with PDZ domain